MSDKSEIMKCMKKFKRTCVCDAIRLKSYETKKKSIIHKCKEQTDS